MRPTHGVIALMLIAAVSSVVLSNTPPSAAFSAYRLADGDDARVLFDASASTDPDGDGIRFQWVFGDGTTGSGMRVEHTFPSVGRYTVTLMAADDIGAWHMITQTVDLADLPPASSATAVAQPSAPALPIGHAVGERAPDFSLPDLDGAFVNLSDFRERVVLLEFWLSTCPGCRGSMPLLEALHDAYADRGFVVLLVSLDDSPDDAVRYLAANGYDQFVVVHEARPVEFGTGAAFGVTSTPHTFLIDRSGVIRLAGLPSLITDDAIEDLL